MFECSYIVWTYKADGGQGIRKKNKDKREKGMERSFSNMKQKVTIRNSSRFPLESQNISEGRMHYRYFFSKKASELFETFLIHVRDLSRNLTVHSACQEEHVHSAAAGYLC